MKPTLKQLSEKYGVDSRTLRTYRDENGVDIYNEEEVELHMETLGISNNAPDEFADKEAFVDMKFKKLTHETNLKKSEAILKDLEVQKRKGELVSINEVSETNLNIASKVKAQLKALTLTLPPKLNGLDMRDMSKVLNESITEVLEYLYAELSIEDE